MGFKVQGLGVRVHLAPVSFRYGIVYHTARVGFDSMIEVKALHTVTLQEPTPSISLNQGVCLKLWSDPEYDLR